MQGSLARSSDAVLKVLKDEPLSWPESFCKSWVDIAARSDFVSESVLRYPHWLSDWAEPDSALFRPLQLGELRTLLTSRLTSVENEEQLMHELRVFRRQQMVRIIWRDLLAYASLEQTLEEVSCLADVCVSGALDCLYGWALEKYGTPLANAGAAKKKTVQKMLVLGMGKLGARELNVSSDIDLIFAYPKNGVTDHPRKPIENQQFFMRLGQRLIHVLDHLTEDGFVFRVDMRLRPYGSSGALALNFSGFEDYYQNQGREWERFAMIKSRIIAGDQDDGKVLLEIIAPFVYRKYADFSSFQALRDMKRMIMSEVHRKGGDRNIKLGSGGIREIEFIVQACQLIHGGRDSRLQQPGLLSVLPILKNEQYLPEPWVDTLAAANKFLRRLEHAIQGLADKQTQLIPADSASRERVAWSLGFKRWDEAEVELRQHREKVSEIFHDFLHDADGEDSDEHANNTHWLHLWQAHGTEAQWQAALIEAGYDDAPQCYTLLEDLRHSRLLGAMSKDAKQRFENFLPMLLDHCAEYDNASLTLERVLSFVRVILGRTVYLVLLYENPHALRQLCKLCSESPWVAKHMAKSPVILDELLDVKSLYHLPTKAELQDQLRQQLLRIPEDDLEAQMDSLRTFRQSHMLRVAAAELGGQLPLMKVSDYLTWLAESLVEQSVNIAWQNLVVKHGLPNGVEASASSGLSFGFAVIAYGKLGGIEMGYKSDLDMVFLYQADDTGMTLGERSINNQVFYTRLGQRIIHILSTQTTQGALYEVDMRLRPSGNSGMLVSSLAAFEKYQRQDAWTWEHQALVRARFIAGDESLGKQFESVRREVLCLPRKEAALYEDVVGMREKMRQAALEKYQSEAQDHIKQGEGGLIDIEFITQYGVLRYARSEAKLLQWSDNIRLLEVLSQQRCFGEVDVEPLIEAYRTLRSALHRKSLADRNYRITLAEFDETRRLVAALWQKIFNA